MTRLGSVSRAFSISEERNESSLGDRGRVAWDDDERPHAAPGAVRQCQHQVLIAAADVFGLSFVLAPELFGDGPSLWGVRARG